MKAVILAGGKGTRLAPYTEVFPKPMLPVKGKPILEILIKQLSFYEIDEIVVSVGYLSDIIKAYFNVAKIPQNIKLTYIKENKPLGTAGPLSLVKDLNQTFLVMNADILSNLNFKNMVKFHKKSKNILTMAACEKETKINYGVIQINGNKELISMQEKPTLDFLVNMGIYVLEPEVLKFVSKNKKLDFPDLVKRVLQKKKKVGVYLNNNNWFDVGNHFEFNEANYSFGAESIFRK